MPDVEMDDTEPATRETLAAFIARMLAAQDPPAIDVAPASRRRFTVRIARVAGQHAVDALVPARGKGDRAALVHIGWERTAEPTGTTYYRRRFAGAEEAVESILAAYSAAYGEVGDGSGWAITKAAGVAAGSDAGAGLVHFVALLATPIVVVAGAATWFALLLHPRPTPLPTVAAAFIAAAGTLIGTFLVATRMRDAQGAQRSQAGLAGNAALGLAIVAAAAAAWIVVRVVPG